MELKIPHSLRKIKNDLDERRENAPRTSKGGRYVLFLGDEGAILIYIKQNRVQSRQFVPDASEHNLKEFEQTLMKDVAAPILLAVDSMDQSYMQQTLPPVSAISVNKLIRRRLERDFANNDIKGAVLLGREKTGRRDWNFMMVALERSPQLTVWLTFLFNLPHRFQGVYVAAVETEMLIKSIDKSMKKSQQAADTEWKFLISHNKVSGFRQVVLKDGKIIFTRLGQPIGDSNPEVIAGGIEQEMFSTIEYMKRLSYVSQQILDIYVITSGGVKAAIDPNKFGATSVTILTPFEVAQYLNIEGAAQPTDQFGDVVMAASIGLSKRHALKLSPPQIRRIDQCYQIVGYQRAAAAMALLVLLGYAGSIGYEFLALTSENSDLTSQRDKMQGDLNDLKNRIKDSKLNVEKASDLIDLYWQINKEKSSPLPFLRKFEALARAPVWIKGIEWSVTAKDERTVAKAKPNVPVANVPASQLFVRAEVSLEFPQEASDTKAFRAVTKKILSDFKTQFSAYDVSYTTQFEDAHENEKLEIRSGKATEKTVVKSLEAKMSIVGPLNPEADNRVNKPSPPAIATP